MPKITEVHLIDITPEKFLENCSPVELMEIDHLIQSPRFRMRMDNPEEKAFWPKGAQKPYPDIDDIASTNLLTCK